MKRLFIMAFVAVSLQPAQAQVNKFRQKYEKFKQEARRKYDNFRDEANRKYAESLLTAWKEYNTLPEIQKPKNEDVPPVVMPEDDKGKEIESIPVIIDEVVIPPSPEPQPVPVAPIPEIAIKDDKCNFVFYGSTYSVRMNDNTRFTINNCNREQLSQIWKVLSTEVCNNTIRDCIELRIKLQLSDWAYLSMIDAFSKSVFGNSNEATLFMAYIYCQSGYSMRLGISENKLHMLYASKHAIYDQPYFLINGINYYPYRCKTTNMEICDTPYPAEKPLSLFIASNQKFEYEASEVRTLLSKRYPELNTNVSVNKNLINFYNTYPASEIEGNFMTRWAMYANTPMGKEIVESLYTEWEKILSDLSKKEAVERILNWVQTAFVYEYDNKVWGQDRAFFAEESLYYPYCDCEDRSILLTRLVRDLLGLKCALVYYPGHLATAIAIGEDVKGDFIRINGTKFLVCDPTYIGAPIGMTMPEMDNKSAKVIVLK